MANTGNGDNWDVTDPANSAVIPDGAKQIRDERIGVALRLSKEHVAPVSGTLTTGSLTSTGGGEHLHGSAVGYVSAAASAPTLRPDGVTALDNSVDKGRLWLVSDLNSVRWWNGSAWVVLGPEAGGISTAMLADGLITTAKLAASAVTAAKITANTITAAQIAAGTITTTEIADGTIVAGDIAAGTITAALLAAGSKIALVKVLTYTGNGGTSGPVITFGFQPDFVITVRTTNGQMLTGISSVTTAFRADGGGDLPNAISYSSTGIQITSASGLVNANAEPYFAVGLKAS